MGCTGCREGYATRACVVSGRRVHRGPDFSFYCTAPCVVTYDPGPKAIEFIPKDSVTREPLNFEQALARYDTFQRSR